MKLYKCYICGNMVVSVNDNGVIPKCCGRDMSLLSPGSDDGVKEKHVPVVNIDGDEVKVTVGSVIHPMTNDHYIEMIIMETDKGIYVRKLTYNDEPKACFKLCKDEKILGVYSYCNIHSLYKYEKE